MIQFDCYLIYGVVMVLMNTDQDLAVQRSRRYQNPLREWRQSC